jgi:hypothetical protein
MRRVCAGTDAFAAESMSVARKPMPQATAIRETDNESSAYDKSGIGELATLGGVEWLIRFSPWRKIRQHA